MHAPLLDRTSDCRAICRIHTYAHTQETTTFPRFFFYFASCQYAPLRHHLRYVRIVYSTYQHRYIREHCDLSELMGRGAGGLTALLNSYARVLFAPAQHNFQCNSTTTTHRRRVYTASCKPICSLWGLACWRFLFLWVLYSVKNSCFSIFRGYPTSYRKNCDCVYMCVLRVCWVRVVMVARRMVFRQSVSAVRVSDKEMCQTMRYVWWCCSTQATNTLSAHQDQHIWTDDDDTARHKWWLSLTLRVRWCVCVYMWMVMGVGGVDEGVDCVSVRCAELTLP